ncbi:uncharacterized protein LOC144467628 [Augochlora pura]
MFGKFVTKVIQSLPSWEVTKYYGRVCIYQFKCLKYKVQTSEAWFNFKCKFMPGSLRNELECEEVVQPKKKDGNVKQKAKDTNLNTETCQRQQPDPKKEDDCINPYVTQEKFQEDYPRKKQRKMKQARQ